MTRDTIDVDLAAGGHIETLAYNGVDYLFGSPGSDDAPYWNYLGGRDESDATPVYVRCRHEQLAVDMARGYAMLTGRPQAVKLHATVGPLNAALSLWGAYRQGTPLVVLSSYVRRHEGEKAGGIYDLDFHQPGGHENNFERYVKWTISLESNETAPQYLSRAFRLAKAPPSGPVLLNMPKELPAEPVDTFDLVRSTDVTPPEPAGDAIDKLAARLEAADRPLAISAGLGGDPAAADALVTLSERVGMGVFETPKTRHGFPMDHPRYLGNSAYGVYHTPRALVDRGVDLVLVVDSSLPWYPPVGGAPNCDIVMLGTELAQPKRAYWNYPADMLIEGDPAAGLRALASAVGAGASAERNTWENEHQRWEERFQEHAQARADREPVDPFWLSKQLEVALPDDAIVVNETVDHGSAVSNLVTDAEDRRYLAPERANAGGLGSGIGLALGAKLAHPDRLVALLIGDGSLQYSPLQAAYGAAQEHDLPILVVVYNNRGYQVMRAAMLGFNPDSLERTQQYGAAIEPTPNYAAQATAWNAWGERVETGSSVSAAIDRAIDAVEEAGQLALLDVILPQEPIADHPSID